MCKRLPSEQTFLHPEPSGDTDPVRRTSLLELVLGWAVGEYMPRKVCREGHILHIDICVMLLIAGE